jgi:hypothetical protein
VATIKSRQSLPDIAKPTADLIERLGFTWELDYEYPLPDMRKRVQIRDEKHSAPKESVTQYAAAMKRGDKFAPVVVTKDGYVVDGATRIAAAGKNQFPVIQTFVLNEEYASSTQKVKQRLHVLGAGFNVRNGRGIDRNEITSAVWEICDDDSYDSTRIAALMGVTEGTVQNIVAEKKAKDRAEKLGLTVNGSLSASQKRTLGRSSDKLNDEPYREVFMLAQDADLTVTDLNDLIKRMKEAGSDQGALQAVDNERKARREQITEYRVSGKSKPPVSARLRQRLGFLLKEQSDPSSFVEHNKDVAQKHYEEVLASIKVLEAVAAAQREFLNKDALLDVTAAAAKEA